MTTTPTDPARRAPDEIDVEALAQEAAGGNDELFECLMSDFLTERGWVGGVRAVIDALTTEGFVVVRREDLDELFRHYGRFRDHPSYLRVKAILAAQDEPDKRAPVEPHNRPRATDPD